MAKGSALSGRVYGGGDDCRYEDGTEGRRRGCGRCWRMGLKFCRRILLSGFGRHFHVNDEGESSTVSARSKASAKVRSEAIIDARNPGGGYFRELFWVSVRADRHQKLNRRVLEKLIMSGAFDRLGAAPRRADELIGRALKAADQHAKSGSYRSGGYVRRAGGKTGNIEQSYASCQPWPGEVVLDEERETLGAVPDGPPHPNRYLKEIERYVGGVRLKDMHPCDRTW